MDADKFQNNRNIAVCVSDSSPKTSFAKAPHPNHEEDFGNFPLNMNDNSFSDLNSDDSTAWMHKIDVSNFKILANDVTNDEISEILNENSHPDDINLSNSSITKRTLSNNYVQSSSASGTNVLSHSNLNFDDSKYSTNFLRYNSEPCIKKLKLVRHDSNLNSDSSNLSPPPHYSQHHYPFPPQVFTPPILDQYPFDHFGMNHHHQPLNANSYESILQSNQLLSPTVSSSTKVYAKPLYSYSCLIALALKNSKLGRLQVSEIYLFMCENFPYFRTAPPGWKNSVRHNLSLNKCFEKIILETQAGHGRKCCLWTVCANKRLKMDQEIRKWRDKDPEGIRESLLNADDLDLIESGQKGLPTEKESQPLVINTLNDRQPSHSVIRPSSSVDWNLLMSHNPNRSLFTPAFPSFGTSSLFPAQPAQQAYARFGSPNPLHCTSRPGSTPVNASYSSDESRGPFFPSNASQGAPYLLQAANLSHSRRTLYANNNQHNVEFGASLPSTSNSLVGRSAEALLLEADSSSTNFTSSKCSMSNSARLSLL